MSPLQRQLRRALGTFKDQTSIGIARVASSSAPDLDVALVRATSHDEAPIEEKYVQEILHLTSYSRGYVSACVAGLGKRLAKTHNWVVAIKALMLTHRLLREGDSRFEEELFLSARRGMRILYMSDFRDDSESHGWDYSSFVRTYALFLDERLEYALAAKSQPEGRNRNSDFGNYGSYNDDYGSGRHYEDQRRNASEDPRKSTPVKDMRPSELLEKLPLMQRLMERVLACRPTGAARINRLVQIALYPVVRESFQYYSDICDGLAIILDAFFDMEQTGCVKAFEIYTRGAKQVDELSSFYGFCKNLGVCRSSEYPAVPRISEDLLETMEDFLRDRSEMSSRHVRPKSPEPRAVSPAKEPAVDAVNSEMNEMKALPAPPIEEPDTVQEATSLQSDADLVDFGDATISTQEHGDRLALALFSDTGSSDAFSSGGGQGAGMQNSNDERSAAGWELALMASSSELSKPNKNIMAGGFDHLLLDSMYEQALDQKKSFASIPAGSASSVALPGRPASSFLALPAPVAQVGEDPFAASVSVPPPSYVQMSDMTQKQQLLVQEQQLWYQYQRDGMQGYNGLMKFYNNGYSTPFQNIYRVPYYGASHY